MSHVSTTGPMPAHESARAPRHDGAAARARLLRDDIVIHDGALGSLKRFKDDVREVRDGFECGIGIDGWGDLRAGDVEGATVEAEGAGEAGDRVFRHRIGG